MCFRWVLSQASSLNLYLYGECLIFKSFILSEWTDSVFGCIGERWCLLQYHLDFLNSRDTRWPKKTYNWGSESKTKHCTQERERKKEIKKDQRYGLKGKEHETRWLIWVYESVSLIASFQNHLNPNTHAHSIYGVVSMRSLVSQMFRRLEHVVDILHITDWNLY